MKAREPRTLEKGERELHLAILALELGVLRDLVTALAARYPTSEEHGTEVVAAALSHLLAVVRLIERRRKNGSTAPPSHAGR